MKDLNWIVLRIGMVNRFLLGASLLAGLAWTSVQSSPPILFMEVGVGMHSL